MKNNTEESTSKGLTLGCVPNTIESMPPAPKPGEQQRKAAVLGGHARAKKLTAAQRSESASKAAKARWANRSKKAQAVAA